MHKIIKIRVTKIGIILIFTMLAVFGKSYAQYGILVNYIKPVGTHAYYFNPSFGAELFLKNKDENSYGFGMSLGLTLLNPRLDTFPTYTIQSSSITTLLPGYIIYKNYYVVTIGINADYKILTSKLTPVIGLDLNFNLHSYTCIERIETIIDSYSDNENAIEIAIVPKIGIRYEMNYNCVFSAGFGKSIGTVIKGPAISYWKTYASVCFYID